METSFAATTCTLSLRSPLVRLVLLVSIISLQFPVFLPCAASGHIVRSSTRGFATNSTGQKNLPNRPSRFAVSSYILSTSHRKKGRNDPRSLRKLASGFGCLTNPSACKTVPGWTPASNASTCCSTGICTDIQFDNLNCGACSMACTFGYFCCSAVCVATAVDPHNCGRCGNVCNKGVCIFGFCSY